MNIRLQQLREEKKVSQSILAKELNVTRQAYSRYEHGDRELGYESLTKLSKFFDVSIDYLLGNTEYYYPDKIATEDERNLLALFNEMTPAQRGRFLAYGDGLLGKSADTANDRKSP